jgi:hypothetical protein
MIEPVGAPNERLLRALAEQLKLPLLQIARQAEMALASGESADKVTKDIASMALQLVDSFLLSNDQHDQVALQLEPVTVSSVLADAAHQLSQMAKHYDTDIEVRLSGKYGPVMAHQPSLLAAMTTLGYSFLETAGRAETRQLVVLGAHYSNQGIVAGLFSEQANLSTDMFRRARALYGVSRQPLQTTLASAGAGVFVADSLLSAMATQLKVARHQNMTGLAATFLPSQQLQLV